MAHKQENLHSKQPSEKNLFGVLCVLKRSIVKLKVSNIYLKNFLNISRTCISSKEFCICLQWMIYSKEAIIFNKIDFRNSYLYQKETQIDSYKNNFLQRKSEQ